MARLSSDRFPADQKTREDRELAEDQALARRTAHLPEDEMRSFQPYEDDVEDDIV
jgi:hypothetical protein